MTEHTRYPFAHTLKIPSPLLLFFSNTAVGQAQEQKKCPATVASENTSPVGGQTSSESTLLFLCKMTPSSGPRFLIISQNRGFNPVADSRRRIYPPASARAIIFIRGALMSIPRADVYFAPRYAALRTEFLFLGCAENDVGLMVVFFGCILGELLVVLSGRS